MQMKLLHLELHAEHYLCPQFMLNAKEWNTIHKNKY